MPDISSLPTEVIWAILDSGPLEHRDLFAACFVRVFHAIAFKLLHQTFPRNANIRMFLAKVLRDPRLAAQVRHLDVSPRSDGAGGDVLLYCNSAMRLGCPPHIKDRWIESLRAGNFAALATLLMAYLPGLQRLHIDIPWETVSPVLGLPRYLTAQASLDRPADLSTGWYLGFLSWRTAFPELREVSIQGIPCPINGVAAVLSLPSLRRLHLGGMLDDDTPMKLAPRCSNVEQLTLNSIGASLQSITDILLACRKLTRFSYRSPVNERVFRNLTALLRTLATFRHSLTEIQIRDLPCLPVGGGSRSLAEFTSLCSLACDASVFTHPSRKSSLSALLPTSLQSIEIHEVYADFWQQFGDFVAIREDLTRTSPHGAPLFRSLDEVRLVRGSELRDRGALYSETCKYNSVTFCVEPFVAQM